MRWARARDPDGPGAGLDLLGALVMTPARASSCIESPEPLHGSAVRALPPGLKLSTGGALTGTPTVAGTYTLSLVADNAASWRPTDLPKGLRVDGIGHLSGRPKKRGRYRFEAMATGSSGQTDSRVFTLRVRRAAR